eukprot:scaffold1261_cov50-Cyclotella_meneghiniana.AAC.5
MMSASDSISTVTANTRRRHNVNIDTIQSTLRHCLTWERTLFIALNALVASMLLVVFMYGQEQRGDSMVSVVGGSSSANGIRSDENNIVVPTYNHDLAVGIQEERKRNCQIIYVLGVEGENDELVKMLYT